MTAKVGAAARHSQSAAPRAVPSPLPPQASAKSRSMVLIGTDSRLACGKLVIRARLGSMARQLLGVFTRGDATTGRSRCVPWARAVEPLEPPEAVQSARIGRIGLVNHAIFQHEGAQARPLAHVGGRVGAGHGRVLDEYLRDRRRRTDAAAPVVVSTAALALLRFGERDVEVEVKLPADR